MKFMQCANNDAPSAQTTMLDAESWARRLHWEPTILKPDQRMAMNASKVGNPPVMP